MSIIQAIQTLQERIYPLYLIASSEYRSHVSNCLDTAVAPPLPSEKYLKVCRSKPQTQLVQLCSKPTLFEQSSAASLLNKLGRSLPLSISKRSLFLITQLTGFIKDEVQEVSRLCVISLTDFDNRNLVRINRPVFEQPASGCFWQTCIQSEFVGGMDTALFKKLVKGVHQSHSRTLLLSLYRHLLTLRSPFNDDMIGVESGDRRSHVQMPVLVSLGNFSALAYRQSLNDGTSNYDSKRYPNETDNASSAWRCRPPPDRFRDIHGKA